VVQYLCFRSMSDAGMTNRSPKIDGTLPRIKIDSNKENKRGASAGGDRF
jgi:hypothetical protein